MAKIEVTLKCENCGIKETKQFTLIEDNQPVTWTCPECGAKTELNFGVLSEVGKFQAKSDYVAKVPKVNE